MAASPFQIGAATMRTPDFTQLFDIDAQIEEKQRDIMKVKRDISAIGKPGILNFRAKGKLKKLHQYEQDYQEDITSLRASRSMVLKRNLLDLGFSEGAISLQVNSPDLLFEVALRSCDTDPQLRENIRKQPGLLPSTYNHGLFVIKRSMHLPEGFLPPIDVFLQLSLDSQNSSSNQIKKLPEGLTLLRTLAVDEDHDETGIMDFSSGSEILLGPGLSTTVTAPHYLGRHDVLLVIHKMSRGVPIAGVWKDGQINEGEVFIPFQLRCHVDKVLSNACFKSDNHPFKRIYDITVEEEINPDQRLCPDAVIRSSDGLSDSV